MQSRNTRLISFARLVLVAIAIMPSVGLAQITDPFPGLYQLSSLDPVNGADGSGGLVIEVAGEIRSGSAGDINGDGIDDIAFISRSTEAAYVVLGGQRNTLGPSLSLQSLNGNNGFSLAFSCSDSASQGFSSASVIPDINGDAVDDFAVGALCRDVNAEVVSKSVYVVYGRAEGQFDPSIDLSQLEGTYGFEIEGFGISGDSAVTVKSAGDINQDGMLDISVLDTDAEKIYIVFGRSDNSFGTSLDISSLDGILGFTIVETHSFERNLLTVSSSTDFNDDGLSDIVVGTSKFTLGNPEFQTDAYILYGMPNGQQNGPTLDLSQPSPSHVTRIEGIRATIPGRPLHVASAGDIDGNGAGDLLISYEGNTRGEVHIFLGFLLWPGLPQFNIMQYGNEQEFVYTIEGGSRSNALGYAGAISAAGDINNDGYDDIIMGDPLFDFGVSRVGGAIVIYGGERRAFQFWDFFDLTSQPFLATHSISFAITGGGESLVGASVYSAGDFNGDGIADVLVGGIFGNNLYVVYGRDVPDCNNNKQPDVIEIENLSTRDWDQNGILDECESIWDEPVTGAEVEGFLSAVEADAPSAASLTAPEDVADFFDVAAYVQGQ